MKTEWTVTISVESEHALTLDALWPDPAERPANPTVEDVRRELFGDNPSVRMVTGELRDMLGMLNFGIEDVKICIFQPVEICDECKRLGGKHSIGCSQRGKEGDAMR